MEPTPTPPAGPAPLTGKQRRHLRALGHHLSPVVHAGKHGLTDELAAAVEVALARHELIKLKLQPECPADRDELAAALSGRLSAHVAQAMGRTLLLYRRHPDEPKIQLPRP